MARQTKAFKVFPCWPGEKLPLRKGWQQSASWDTLAVDAMWLNDPKANIGLAIEPGFLAIDADLYKTGREAALALYEKTHGTLPDTLEFYSARGGVHLIYATDRNLGNSRGTLPDFGDVRGHGGLIIGPGSWFEGLRYGVEHLAMPDKLPEHVSSRLVERKHRDPEERRELPQFVQLDDEINVERFVAWLKGPSEISVENQGGNNVLAKTGAMGSSYALSWDVTLECMQDHWNPRCEPPWDDSDLERHGGSGYRSASSKFGNMATKRYFSAVQADQPTGKLLFGATMLETIKNLPADLVQDMAAAGELTILAGDRGVGKSAVLAGLAHAVVTGQPFLMNPVLKPGKVLIIAAEGARRTIRDFQAACLHAKEDPADIMNRGFAVYRGSLLINKSEGREELLQAVEAFVGRFGEPPALMAFDTVRKNMTGSVSKDDDVNEVFRAYEAIWEVYPTIALIGIAHTAKAFNGAMSTKGSTDWEQGADTVLWLAGKVRDKATTLTYEKLKAGEDGRSIGVDFVFNDAEGFKRTIVAVHGGSRVPETPQA